MRRADVMQEQLFTVGGLGQIALADHPLREVCEVFNGCLARMDSYFDTLYSSNGRESIPTEKLGRDAASTDKNLIPLKDDRISRADKHKRVGYHFGMPSASLSCSDRIPMQCQRKVLCRCRPVNHLWSWRRLFCNSIFAPIIFFVGYCSTVAYAQYCPVADAIPVTDFGSFIANASDAAVRIANTNTLNKALDEVGKQINGGIVNLPPGTFYLTNYKSAGAAVVFTRNNVVLQGAGMDGSQGGTKLVTRSDYNLDGSGAVFRGSGMLLVGNANPATPLRNIALRDFELDGGAGFTGNFGFPANPATGDGWDITHKGIILSSDSNVDGVTIERVWVHSYRGEVIYAGGSGLGQVSIRSVKSEDTNASTYNITANATVENSEFGKSRFWIEIGTRFTNKAATFRNNYFHDASVDGAIALVQGDLGNQPYRFEGNRFERCVGAGFIFTGGVGGPVAISNNTFLQCGGLAIATAPMSDTPQNQNITFENNILTDGPFLANFFAVGRNITIRNNTFNNTRAAKGASTAAFICCSTLDRVVIENNVFRNMRAPENSAEITAGERPLFRGNQYINAELRDGQGLTRMSSGSRVVRPIYEEARIESDAPNVEAILSVDRYPEGQEVTITGGTVANPIKFSSNATSYQVAANRLLNGSDSLRFRFSKALGKWVEIP
jgi:hypothetical protein